jgi:hypothetical protein
LNYKIARKAMLARPDAIRLKWIHRNIYEHREPGLRAMPHGVRNGFFFRRGEFRPANRLVRLRAVPKPPRRPYGKSPGSRQCGERG